MRLQKNFVQTCLLESSTWSISHMHYICAASQIRVLSITRAMKEGYYYQKTDIECENMYRERREPECKEKALC